MFTFWLFLAWPISVTINMSADFALFTFWLFLDWLISVTINMAADFVFLHKTESNIQLYVWILGFWIELMVTPNSLKKRPLSRKCLKCAWALGVKKASIVHVSWLQRHHSVEISGNKQVGGSQLLIAFKGQSLMICKKGLQSFCNQVRKV